MSEAPRGALAHWIVIKDQKIDNYQLVVPSTWNASPRDAKGQRSAYEASLIGTPVANTEQPAGDPADDPLVRPVHRLRRPHPRPARAARASPGHLLRRGDHGHHDNAPSVFDRVYIWERPVRLYHWVTVVSMLVLIATGLIVGRPPAFMTTGDASASQWFGTVRFVHFAAATCSCSR